MTPSGLLRRTGLLSMGDLGPRAVEQSRRAVRAGLLLVALAFLPLQPSCIRPVSVGSPRPTYSIDVHNALDVDMLVSYDAGSGARALGAVTPGATERFVIAVLEPGPITVTARSGDGSRTSGPWEAVLGPAATPRIILH